MKFKKAQYQYGMSGGKKILIFLIVIIAIFSILYYYDIFDIKMKIKKTLQNTKEKTSSLIDDKNKYESHTPEISLEWCKTQVIPVDSSEYSPISIEINGENNVEQCCEKSFSGYNNCLNKSVNLIICYTSSLGGEIKYLTINKEYYNPSYYQTYIKDIHKIYNPYYKPEISCNKLAYK